ncbi:NADP-dependent oxidoreductase [Leifsonia virtsii]|uniref:NADP-dependent oxidoreductase n=1 Tax=Leifsonia virtsii TaxID=3035915 RepID=A0ABT8J2S3_9MICO|nr:NADP-dependent oxidoreductase [Leifsonia virtsii]MDN4599173.1 NADP-dependent oxidoreductase [Leifsonia virtsii]
MKAVRFHEHGGPEVLRYEDIEQPAAGPGQVLLRVAGVAFNAADGGIREGRLPIPVALPHTPGYDVSGTVAALGDGVDGLAAGEAVIGFLPMTDDGAAAEYVLAPAEALVAAPASIPLEDAADLPSVALTAWQALFDDAGLGEGQRVLIVGAGGPVGGYAVQLAARAGAHVIATASPRSRDSVAASGADEVVDHTTTSLLEAVTEPVDVLLNLAPLDPDEFAGLLPLVADGGVVVSTTAWMPAPSDEERGVRGIVVFVRSDAAQLAELVSRVDRGELRVEIARRVPLSELPAIHAESAAGTLRGKVVALPGA